MTITVELPSEIEERFLAQARDRGLSLDAYVQEFLARSAQQVLADTNILLRRIHRSHPQHRQTRDAITRIVARGDLWLCVTSQNPQA